MKQWPAAYFPFLVAGAVKAWILARARADFGLRLNGAEMTHPHIRDFLGYGGRPIDPKWPKGARLALSIVLNYEEGGEYSILNGDAHSETILADMGGLTPLVGQRDLNVESVYEYGSRVGFWRIMRVLEAHGIPITVYAVGRALEQHPDAAAAMVEAGYELASHGWRWIDYAPVPIEVERAHMQLAIEAIRKVTGEAPVGWYTGRPSINTRQLVVESGGFLYDSDAYNDDLPYWVEVTGRPHLVLPYSFLNNDSRFNRGQGFEVAEEFFIYLRDAFDWLYAEGADMPRMMSVGLHCRLVGQAGRIAGLARFLDHVLGHDGVWICRRRDIAEHWLKHHPAG